MYDVIVRCDSVGPHNVRLTTLEVTFPRFMLAEFNTHRMLSRNAASSRAIPTAKIISAVQKDPYIPGEWGSKKPGMQAGPPVEDDAPLRDIWIRARDQAIDSARWLDSRNVHKQLVNRLLEPFMWVTVVVTATDWDNFFNLRTHPDAQPEFRNIARLMRSALQEATPERLQPDAWHMPYITPDDKKHHSLRELLQASAARCARVSYLTQTLERDIAFDIKLAKTLLANGHMSPFEHPAVCQEIPRRIGNFTGWTQYRKLIPREADPLGYRPE